MSWRLKAESVPAEPAAKKSRAREGEEDDEEELTEASLLAHVKVLTKATLQNCQMLRAVFGAMMVCYLLPPKHCMIGACSEAGATYDREVKKLGKGHQLGSPHGHVAIAGLEALAEAPVEDKAKGSKEFLGKVVREISENKDGLLVVGSLIAYFRIKEVYAEEKEGAGKKSKLVFALDPLCEHKLAEVGLEGAELGLKLKQAAGELLVATGSERKLGPPPRNDLERVLQKKLKALQGKSKA